MFKGKSAQSSNHFLIPNIELGVSICLESPIPVLCDFSLFECECKEKLDGSGSALEEREPVDGSNKGDVAMCRSMEAADSSSGVRAVPRLLVVDGGDETCLENVAGEGAEATATGPKFKTGG